MITPQEDFNILARETGDLYKQRGALEKRIKANEERLIELGKIIKYTDDLESKTAWSTTN